jgi:predicted GNAT family acetyltransferase
METRIERVESQGKGAFIIYVAEQKAGEMTYSRASDELVIIDHTGVDDDFRGMGLAKKLVEAGVLWARETQTRLMPLCPYAKAAIDKTPEWQDVVDR